MVYFRIHHSDMVITKIALFSFELLKILVLQKRNNSQVLPTLEMKQCFKK